jgi:hypothetical protein
MPVALESACSGFSLRALNAFLFVFVLCVLRDLL